MLGGLEYRWPVSAAGRGLLQRGVIVVDSIATLKALSSPSSAVTYFVSGYYAAGDGGGGVYRWMQTDASADNGGTVLQPNAAGSAGRWNRIFDKFQYGTKVWGAKGDDATDDTARLQALITASKYVYVQGGTYRHSGLTWPNNTAVPTVIEGEGWGTSILKYTGAGIGLSAVTRTARNCVSISRVRITNAGAIGATVGVDLSACEHGKIDYCKVDGFSIGQTMGNTTTADAYFCDVTNNLFDNNTTHVYNKATYPVPLMISNKNYWTKNKFNGGTTGYKQDYGDCNTIRDNTFENMTNAIVISKGRKNSIVDNYIDSTVSGTGITIGANAGGDCAYNYHFNPQNDAATPISDQGGAPMYDGRVQSRGVYVVNTAKAWASINGPVASLRNSFGVSSVTRTAAGRYTVNLIDALPGANPHVSVTGDDSAAGYWGRFAWAAGAGVGASSYNIEYVNAAGAFADCGYMSTHLYGGT